MRYSLCFASALMVLGLVASASAIEPVGSAAMSIEPIGSASRGVAGESSRRVATPTPAESAAPAGAQNIIKTQAVKPAAGAAAQAAPFGWQTNVEEACRLGRQHNLPVLVFVTSAHCPYCTKMKQETFRTASVIQEVDAKFVPLRIERGSNPQFERQLGIKSYPTTIVLRGDKLEVARMAGFIQAPQFLGNLKKIESQWPVLNASRPTTKR